MKCGEKYYMLELIDVDPVDPVAPWLGGKSQLSKVLCPLIDRVPHVTYAEPFVGMGESFFGVQKNQKLKLLTILAAMCQIYSEFCKLTMWRFWIS